MLHRELARSFFLAHLAHGVACTAEPSAVSETRRVLTPETLTRHCAEAIGEPRVLEPAPGIFVAVGYDVSNTALIHTSDGNIVIDTMTSPQRAEMAREALLARAPGPTLVVVFTHSHVDHIGGAKVWIEEGTEIWATESFAESLVHQYGVFRPAESRRGMRQFGRQVSSADLPCSALGRSIDFATELGGGIRMPTHLFAKSASFEIGGVRVELHAAPGETADQLLVWLPERKVLFPGDNIYRAFPNLYTIRGGRPRPFEPWIASLDNMRRLEPEVLVPSHTIPMIGAGDVAAVLRDYRDGIAYVHAAVIRGANRGESLDDLAASVALPEHLAKVPHLAELYGQIDWSVRADYTNELGWFDGRPERLYRLSPAEEARREIELMGGEAKVLDAAARALESGEAVWALRLIDRALSAGCADPRLPTLRARGLRAVASGVANSNGRAYLLQFAHELEAGPPEPIRPTLDPELIDALPIEVFFAQLPGRLKIAASGDVEASLAIELEGEPARRVFVTVRRGVAEIAYETPLPGTPPPVATVHVSATTWKRLALGLDSPLAAMAAGRLSIDGSRLDVKAFLDRFDRSL